MEIFPSPFLQPAPDALRAEWYLLGWVPYYTKVKYTPDLDSNIYGFGFRVQGLRGSGV